MRNSQDKNQHQGTSLLENDGEYKQSFMENLKVCKVIIKKWNNINIIS